MKIAFYKGKTIVDKTILFFSRGGYAHCAMRMNDGSIIEVKPFQPVSRLPKVTSTTTSDSIIDIYEVETTAEQDVIIEDFLKRQMGKPYDYISILGFVLYATPSGRKKYGKWICSELVFAAFQKAGINLLERVDAWKVSPTILSYSPNIKLCKSINFKY